MSSGFCLKNLGVFFPDEIEEGGRSGRSVDV